MLIASRAGRVVEKINDETRAKRKTGGSSGRAKRPSALLRGEAMGDMSIGQLRGGWAS